MHTANIVVVHVDMAHRLMAYRVMAFVIMDYKDVASETPKTLVHACIHMRGGVRVDVHRAFPAHR